MVPPCGSKNALHLKSWSDRNPITLHGRYGMPNGQHPVICFLYLKFHHKISHKSKPSVFDLVTDKLLQGSPCLIFNSIKSESSHMVFEISLYSLFCIFSLDPGNGGGGFIFLFLASFSHLLPMQNLK